MGGTRKKPAIEKNRNNPAIQNRIVLHFGITV